MERDNEPIPEPTPINELKLETNQIPALTEVWMPLVRNEMDNKSVKKTLTIPQWLNIKEKLGIREYKH